LTPEQIIEILIESNFWRQDQNVGIERTNYLNRLSGLAQEGMAVTILISFNSIKGLINMPVDTVERYSEYLNNAFLFFYLKRFSYSLKDQEKNPRKVFCIDSGLRNAVSMGFSEDRGKVLENIVFQKFLQKGNEVYYWKDKQGCEVDFIVVEGGKVTGVYQVSYSVREARTKTRETNALIRALICFDLNEGTIITENQEMEETLKGFRIRYMPVWKFLLS
jgi:predicted AAA+ superfamily ATPase